MPDAESRDVRALAESLTGAGIPPRQKRIPVGVVAFGRVDLQQYPSGRDLGAD